MKRKMIKVVNHVKMEDKGHLYVLFGNQKMWQKGWGKLYVYEKTPTHD